MSDLLAEAKQVERAISRVRWAAVGMVFILGPVFPNLSLAAVFSLGVYVIAYNLVAIRASTRAETALQHARVVRLAFAGDLVTIAVAMFLFSNDPLWKTHFAGALAIIAAAFRFGTRGTLLASAALSLAYLVTSAYRVAAFGYAMEWYRVAFDLSLFVLPAFLLDHVLLEIRRVRAEREELIGRLERRVAEDAALAQATRIVASRPASSDVVLAVLRASRPVLGFDRVSVLVADEERQCYRVVHRLGRENDHLPPPRGEYPMQGLLADAMAAGRATLVPDMTSEPRNLIEEPWARPRSQIFVPMAVGGRPVALLSLTREQPNAFGVEDVRLAEVVAGLIAQVLDNERLFADASQAEALRALDRLKDEFLTTVSHELRTPLTVISGALQRLALPVDELAPRSRRLIEQATRNVERLQHCVEDLLDLAQLQEARIGLLREPISGGTLLADVAAVHEIMAAQRSQRLAIMPEDNQVQVWVDRRRMLQVLGNLVANAIRYSPPGSEIELEITQTGDEVRFAVRDEGPGVPLAERERIFERFYRMPSSRDERGGTGLGLAIAKSLAELHGGRLWVETRIDKTGSAFVVALPVQSATVARR